MSRLARSMHTPNLLVLGVMVILICVCVTAVIPGLIAPYDPVQIDMLHRLVPPVWFPSGTLRHVLGTDQLGRDVLSRLIYGAQVSIAVALSAVTLAAAVGFTLGVSSGYFGGWVDRLSMRIVDVQLAFPAILLAIALVAVLGPGFWKVVTVLAATGWVSFARVVRGATLSMRSREYVEAARAIGASSGRILLHQVCPNVLGPTIVIATLEVSRVIIVEASLGFLGLGVQPPTPSWGNMISDARVYLATDWWLSALPGAAIALTCLSANVLGDWVRDIIDPRLRTDQHVNL